MILEVVAFNLQSALIAAEFGADRIEICENFFEGGTSPSFGCVETLKEKLQIPVFPMIRPRGGDFLYDKAELDAMIKDIQKFKNLECEGIVLGVLRKDGTINTDVISMFVEIAYPMNVTFHRAFDRVKDQSIALEQIISCGCKRVLTSGGHATALDGVNQISQIVLQANDRIKIVVGGGVTFKDISYLIDKTGATEFHTPARKFISSKMEFNNLTMNEDLNTLSIDKNEIINIKNLFSQRII